MSIAIATEVLDGCVLGLLAHADDYGYALTQQVQAVLPVSESTMYPVLRRLNKMLWVTTYDRPVDGRNRRYYAITDLGQEQLAKIRHDWHHYRSAVDHLLTAPTD
ncbi:PadR family transcriptional regulator [Lacticaseibacillus sp. N501-2]|uniref:PadR family transcriptional regulator n=1 Tax=Lacticaseibacillus salsurae TaxID=3367729 RepID=UPI0038B39E71